LNLIAIWRPSACQLISLGFGAVVSNRGLAIQCSMQKFSTVWTPLGLVISIRNRMLCCLPRRNTLTSHQRNAGRRSTRQTRLGQTTRLVDCRSWSAVLVPERIARSPSAAAGRQTLWSECRD
jgi:hypothetical protein